jgi:hypothetical protein
MGDTAGSPDQFCEEQMRTRRSVLLAELSSSKEFVRVGTRSKKESADIVANLLQLPCRNAYALDPDAPIVRDPRTGQTIALPEPLTLLRDFILELPTGTDGRRAVFQGIRQWIESQGYELPADAGQRFIFLSIE